MHLRSIERLTPFLLSLAATAALLATSGCQKNARPAAHVRNVILITVDTLRADAVGFAGNREVSTPVLDRLAAAGRVFDDAHAHCVTTLPSHASILTGLYPFQHGVRHNGGYVLAATVPTLASQLMHQGFATAAFVGAFPLDARFGLDRGFATYDDATEEEPPNTETPFFYPERRGDVVVERATRWWSGQSSQRRFLWLHLFDPHAPYLPPEPFATDYASSPYLGEVAAVDAYLAPLLERFLAGDEEPTLIVFTSDHGEALGEHGEQTHGLFAYEATLKVPLFLWGAGIEPGIDSRAARHIDLAPTILEALGEVVPAELPGRSLLAAAQDHPEVSFFEALSGNLDFGWAPLRGVLRGGEKYIELPIPELYDLRADPAESDNRSASQRGTARQLAELLPEESTWPPSRGEITAAETEHLGALGYLSGPTVKKSRYSPADDPKNLVHLDRKVTQLAELSTTGQPQQAIELAHEILAERPTMGVVYIYLSTFLLQTGDYHEAIRIMRLAQDYEVASRDLERQLGLTLVTVGQAGAALEVLEPLASEPSDTEARNLQALALIYLDRFDEAQMILGDLIAAGIASGASEPRFHEPRFYENLSLLEIRRERFAAAENAARKALELDPGLVSSWNNLGVALYNLGRREEAIGAWRRSLDLAPNDVDTLLNLGIVEAQIGDPDGARVALLRFLDIAPGPAYEAKRREARQILKDLEE